MSPQTCPLPRRARATRRSAHRLRPALSPWDHVLEDRTLLAADLSITKTGPATVIAGTTTANYTVTVTNIGDADATNVNLSDTIPAGATLNGFDPATDWDSESSTPTGPISAVAATIPVGGTRTLIYTLDIAPSTLDGSILTNTATVTADVDGDPTNNSTSFDSTVSAEADLAVTKSDSPDPVVAGTDLTYTITVTNAGPSDAQAVSLSDVLPAGTSLSSFTTPSPGWSLSFDAGTGTATATRATLPAGSGPQTFTLVVQVDSGVADGATISNTATATSDTADPTPGNNSATAETAVTAEADLSVLKQEAPFPAVAGTDHTYTITVTNNGPSDAQAVSLSDALPAGMTFVSLTSPAGWSPTTPAVGSGGTVTATLPTLVAGSGPQIFTLVVRVNPDVPNGSIISNTADVSTSTPDPDPANDSSTVGTPIVAEADLAVTKSDSPDPVVAGTDLTYTITVTNAGPSDAQAVSLSDVLPAGTSLSSFTTPSPGWSLSFDAGTGTATATRATLPAGSGPQTFTLVVQVDSGVADGATISNTATATSDTADPTPGNNSATADTGVITRADLVTVKSGPAIAVAGLQATYTISVTNAGPSDAQDVALTDSIPAGATFASFGGATDWALCSTDSEGPISCANGTLAAGATLTLVYTLNIDPSVLDGTILTNTATASSTTIDPNPGDETDSFDTLVIAIADLQVTKSAPETDVAGTGITYTITLTNAGPSDAQDVALADDLVDALTFLDQSQGDTGPQFNLSVSAGGVINNTIATLAAGASQTFTVTALISPGYGPGPLPNTATGTSTTTDDNPDNNTDTATTFVFTEADLVVAKLGPAEVVAGEDLTYTIILSNAGPSDARNVVLSDFLPPGLTLLGQSQTPAGPQFFLGNFGDAINDTIAVLPAGAGQTFTVTARVSPAAPAGPITNTASADSETFDPDPSDSSHSVTTLVRTEADLVISKSGPVEAVAGTGFSYTITVSNVGPSDAQDVLVLDFLPAGVRLLGQSQSPSGPQFNLAGFPNVIDNTIAVLPAGASQTFTVLARLESGAAEGPLSNTASISSGTFDPDPSDNSSTTTLQVLTFTDLSILKTGPATAVAGQEVTYNISVRNDGPSDALNVNISDLFGPNLTPVSFVQTGGPAIPGTLPAGAVATFRLVARINPGAPAGTSVTNTAFVTTTTTDTNPSNDSSATTLVASTRADVAVVKTGPATGTAGQDITYTITVSNNGPSDAQNVALSDVLPSGTTLVSQAQGGTGPQFTLQAFAGAILDTIAVLPAGASQTFTVVAHLSPTPPRGGIVTNTATVSTTTTDPNPSNNTSSASTAVLTPTPPPPAGADLAVTKIGPIAARAGQTITYLVTVTNFGPSDAANVYLYDSMNGGAKFVSQTQGAGAPFVLSHTPILVTDRSAVLRAGASQTFVITVRIDPTGPRIRSLINTATVFSSTTDPNYANNQARAVTAVRPDAPIAAAGRLQAQSFPSGALAVKARRPAPNTRKPKRSSMPGMSHRLHPMRLARLG